jgi:hypothetical protein
MYPEKFNYLILSMFYEVTFSWAVIVFSLDVIAKVFNNGIASPSLPSGLRLTRAQRQMASLMSLRGV